jgi:CheY-like chemotaxis protein
MDPKPLSLVVEDDEDLSVIFSEALRKAGFQVETIRDGLEAKNRLEAVTPAVLVLDIHLPHVAGTEILAYVHSQPAKKERINVVVVTADALIAEELRDQADFVLVKPITFGQLRDLTSRLLPPGTAR